MALEKRTSKQIEADVKKIQEAAKNAKSLKEISEITGITVRKIGTSLEGHAIIKKRVLAALAENRKKGTIPAESEAIASDSETETVKEPIKVYYPVSEETEEFRTITICDAPALVNGLTACFATPITIPHYVYDSLIGLAKTDKPDSQRAKNALVAIDSTYNWCTIAEKLDSETLLVDSDEKPGWREKALVALACKYWSDGYHVTIKTRTGSIAQLARLQNCFTVDFVKADNEDYVLKAVS